MKLQSITCYSLIISLATLPSFTFAYHQTTTTISGHTVSAIQSHEKNFDFDWNNYASIASNQAKINATEAFLKTIKNTSNLSAADKLALGQLLYKLGTYYTHVARQPDWAIEKMNLADTLFTNKQDKAWNDNHLAYAYEQKYAASGQLADKEKALDYTNKVIALFSAEKNKEAAFAYCVKGLVLNDAKDFAQAETNYKNALSIYEKLPAGKDDQYARAKNRLAIIILDQNNRDKEALAMLQELKNYWVAKGDIQKDPYAARNFISLGQAYLKVGNAQAARDEFDRAIRIYKNVYGDNSELLAKPYQLLADSYKQLGATSQALKH